MCMCSCRLLSRFLANLKCMCVCAHKCSACIHFLKKILYLGVHWHVHSCRHDNSRSCAHFMQPASSTMSGSDDTRVLLSAIHQSAKKMVGTKSKQQFISNNTHLFFIIVLSAVVSFDCKSILRLWLSITDKHFTDDTFLPDIGDISTY